MSPVNGNSFLFVLVLSLKALEESSTAALPTDASKVSLFPTIMVEIFNELPNGAPVTIHCKSKDDNLGTHVLNPSQGYSFQFKVNFLGTTLFFCRASWQGGHVEFDIYDAERDNNQRCYLYCRWEARKDAILGFQEENNKTDISYKWKH